MKSANKVVTFRPPARNSAERAFLPAALEIQETPPSPIGRAISLAIISTLCIALLLAAIGSIDIVASAQGKVVPSGRTKIVQPLEAGVVRSINVRDGQAVHTGDVLVELDLTVGAAERKHLEADLETARLDVARLSAALGSEDPMKSFEPQAGIDSGAAEATRSFLESQIAEHRAKLSSLDRQIVQKRAEVETVGASIAKIEALLPVLKQRVDIRSTLFDQQLGSKLNYLEVYQAYVELQSELKVQASRRKEAEASLTAITEARTQADAEWRRGLFGDLVEARRKAAGLAQDVARATQKMRFQVLTAPVDGVVQQLAVHTVGGVVTPAQALLAIVPQGDDIEVEALVTNRDIGFIEVGQPAEIKVDTFNFTRYGLVHGEVSSVSQDAISRDRTSDRSSANPGAEAASSEPRNQDLVYSARVALSHRSMQVEGRNVPLLPGMAVTVEIKTGSRTVLSYLLSPLQRYRSESLRER